MSYRDAIEAVQPYFTLVGPGIAAWFVVRGWERNHTDASDRDLRNWRRTTLLDVTTKLADDLDAFFNPIPNEFTQAEINVFVTLTAGSAKAKIDRGLLMLAVCDAPEVLAHATSATAEIPQTLEDLNRYLSLVNDDSRNADRARHQALYRKSLAVEHRDMMLTELKRAASAERIYST